MCRAPDGPHKMISLRVTSRNRFASVAYCILCSRAPGQEVSADWLAQISRNILFVKQSSIASRASSQSLRNLLELCVRNMRQRLDLVCCASRLNVLLWYPGPCMSSSSSSSSSLAQQPFVSPGLAQNYSPFFPIVGPSGYFFFGFLNNLIFTVWGC
jgi:hypothetical protein